MALSAETLTGIAERLDGPLTEVQAAVQRVVTAEHPGVDTPTATILTKRAALDLLEAATDAWLGASGNVEDFLVEFVSHEAEVADEALENALDARDRLGGMTLIHLALASDLAKLASIDDLGDDDPVSAADLLVNPALPSAIRAVTGNGTDEGRVLEAVTLVAENLDGRDDDDDGDPDVHQPGVNAANVLEQLVDRAGTSVRSVLVGAAPSPHILFLAVSPLLEAARDVGADQIAAGVGSVGRSIARLVMKIFRRVRDVINAILTKANFKKAIDKFLEHAEEKAQEKILDPLVRSIVAKILGETEMAEDIRKTWVARRQEGLRIHRHIPDPDNEAALRKLLKRNKRWVARPVPIAARHLHPLWAVPIGPVPAAPIAASLLLAWTILYTGDQLDSPGAFPNFWRPGLKNIPY